MGSSPRILVHAATDAPIEPDFVREAALGVVDAYRRRPVGGVVTLSGSVGTQVAVKLARRRMGRCVRCSLRLSPTRSRAAFDLAHYLVASGVATPRPYAVAEARSMSWRPSQQWDVLVSEYVAAPNLAQRLRRDFVQADRWIRAAALEVARMHAASVTHRDLKASNLLVGDGPEGPRAFIIDLDGARRRRLAVPAARRARDLGRLFVSLDVLGADSSALVDAYVEAVGLGEHDALLLLQRIEGYARIKRAQNALRGRPLS